MRATTSATSGRAVITGVAMTTQRTMKGKAAVVFWVAEMPTIPALVRGRNIRLDRT